MKKTFLLGEKTHWYKMLYYSCILKSFELTNIYTSTYRLAHIYWILGWVLECEEEAGSWQLAYSSSGGVAHWRVFRA